MTNSRLPWPWLHDARLLYPNAIRSDVVAGATTAILLVPQGIAYAMLAGLPPVVGLYAALVPAVGYWLVGSSRELSVGPVAIDSLLVLSALSGLSGLRPSDYPAAAALLALLVGSLQLVMGGLRLGYLVRFLSQPVLSGFTSAAALLITLSQVPPLLGLKALKTNTLLEAAGELSSRISGANLQIALLSVGMLAFLIVQKHFWPRLPGTLLVIVVVTLAAGPLGFHLNLPRVDAVASGFPTLELPHAAFHWARPLASSAGLIALVGFLESITVARHFAKRGRYPIYPDRELLALGASNLLAGLFQGYPVAGGLSRTAVNAQAGARTSAASLVTATLVGGALLWLTPWFAHIPRAALAATVVTAAVGLVDWKAARELFRVQPSEGVLLVVTFAATATWGMLEGLLTGMVASVTWMVARTARPHLAVLGRVPGTLHFKNINRYPGLITYDQVLLVRLDAELYFANAEFLQNELQSLEREAAQPLIAIILDASSIHHMDSSAIEILEQMVEDYTTRNIRFYIAGLRGPVQDILRRAGFPHSKLTNTQCLTVHEALQCLESARKDTPPHHVSPRLAPMI